MTSIGEYREKNGLKLDELAERLGGISRGHASDLCNGRKRPSEKIARHMQELTGRPWHEFMDEAAAERSPAEVAPPPGTEVAA